MEFGAADKMGIPYSSINDGNRDALTMKSPFSQGQLFLKGKRKALNIVAIVIALFVPWLVFCSVYALFSFSLHYRLPIITYIAIGVVFVAGVLKPVLWAAYAQKKKLSDPDTYQPSWYVFLAVTCLLAFILASVAGEWNYTNFMQRYYDLGHMADYKDIDTNDNLGQQLMDAGRIVFRKGTVLDLGRSMGFKNHDIYCVSPIVTKGLHESKPLSVDFWAVGKNCCSGVSADFHCQGFSDPHATSAVRLMDSEDRAFYRLAVQQAEATYQMTATHPLFFRWVHDAQEETQIFKKKGIMNFFLGICSYFLLQLFLVWVCTILFSKLMHY